MRKTTFPSSNPNFETTAVRRRGFTSNTSEGKNAKDVVSTFLTFSRGSNNRRKSEITHGMARIRNRRRIRSPMIMLPLVLSALTIICFQTSIANAQDGEESMTENNSLTASFSPLFQMNATPQPSSLRTTTINSTIQPTLSNSTSSDAALKGDTSSVIPTESSQPTSTYLPTDESTNDASSAIPSDDPSDTSSDVASNVPTSLTSSTPTTSAAPTTIYAIPTVSPTLTPVPTFPPSTQPSHPTAAASFQPSIEPTSSAPTLAPTPLTNMTLERTVVMTLVGVAPQTSLAVIKKRWETQTSQHIQLFWNQNLPYTPVYIGKVSTLFINETRFGSTNSNNNDKNVALPNLRVEYSQIISYAMLDEENNDHYDGGMLLYDVFPDLDNQLFTLPFTQNPQPYTQTLVGITNSTRPIWLQGIVVRDRTAPIPLSGDDTNSRIIIITVSTLVTVLLLGAGGYILYMTRYKEYPEESSEASDVESGIPTLINQPPTAEEKREQEIPNGSRSSRSSASSTAKKRPEQRPPNPCIITNQDQISPLVTDRDLVNAEELRGGLASSLESPMRDTTFPTFLLTLSNKTETSDDDDYDDQEQIIEFHSSSSIAKTGAGFEQEPSNLPTMNGQHDDNENSSYSSEPSTPFMAAWQLQIEDLD